MRCPHCELKIVPNPKLDCCPACGTILNEKEKKPGFERTWALIQEDQFKKNPSPKLFEQTWQWYAKAIAANPAETIYAARFLASAPDCRPDLNLFAQQADSIEDMFGPQNISSENERTAAGLSSEQEGLEDPVRFILRYGALHLDPASILQLYSLDCKEAAGLRTIMEKAKQQNKLPAVLEPFDLVLQGRYEQARHALKALMRLDDKEPLVLDRPYARKLYTHLAGSQPGRTEQIRHNLEQPECIETGYLLDALYRPLDDLQHVFDHLYHLPDGLEDALLARKEDWISGTRKMLEKDECLRGIHIALQTLKQKDPRLAGITDELLALQYEKAYLRPFKEIEQTDFQW